MVGGSAIANDLSIEMRRGSHLFATDLSCRDKTSIELVRGPT